MLDPKLFHDIVSGRRRGIGAQIARTSLAAARYVYASGVYFRNRRFDRAHASVTRVEVPVISVGNLTLGGTGKTPLIAWLAKWFRSAGLRPAILSRGYRAQAGTANDEALELAQQLEDVPHLQNPDRVAVARTAVDELHCQVLLVDDGFQHRRLHRDLDIVLLDALCPFGYGQLFPRGTLREPISALRRSHIVALTRADMISAEQRDWIRTEVHRVAPHVTWITARHAATELVSHSGLRRTPDTICNQDVAAFCGIGNPTGFWRTLASLPVNVVATREFPDHHHYQREDLAALDTWASITEATMVLCTRKDLVKIDRDALGGLPLWAVGVEMEMTAGESALIEHLQPILRRVLSRC
jgi:tetraacyldisaccharide 4'-kinase